MRGLLRLLGWRLVTRHRARTLLVTLAIAVPVALTVAIASLAATAQITDDETQAMTMGTADATVKELTRADIHEAVSPGARLVRDDHYADMPLTATNGSRPGTRVESKGRAIDLRDPLTDGMFVTETGAVSGDPASIALSTRLAAQLGVGVGDGVAVGPSGQPRTVSALLVYPRFASDVFFITPTAVPVSGPRAGDIIGTRNWLVGGAVATDVDPQRFAVTDRRTVTSNAGGSMGLPALAGVLGLGLLAEMLLLISAAATLVVREQTRTAGLLAAVGVPGKLRMSFLASYVRALAVIGVCVGTAVGLAAAYALQGPLQTRAEADWGRFTPAWAMTVGASLVTALAVTATCAAPRRALNKRPLLHLLGSVPEPGRALTRRGWVIGAALLLLGGIGFGSSFAVPQYASLTAIAGAIAAAAGIAVLALAVAGRWARRAALPGTEVVVLAVRHVLASSSRAALAVVAIAVVAVSAAFLQTTSAMLVDQALRHRATPVPDGQVLFQSPRPLTPAETTALHGQVHSFVPVSGRDTTQVTAVTDLMDCISRTVRFEASGGFDPHACEAGSQAKVVFPRVVAASAADVAVLARPGWSAEEQRRFAAGEVAVASGPTGTGASIRLAQPDELNDHLRFVDPVTIGLVQAPDASRLSSMPTIYLSPRAVQRLGYTVGDPQYLLAAPDVESARRLLPSDLAVDARLLAGEDSPFLAPARATLTLAGVAGALVVAGIMAVVMALWSNDLWAARQMLTAMGMPRRRLRASAAVLAALLAGLGLVLGVTFGVVGARAFMEASGIPPSTTWAPLATLVAGLLACVAVGGASVSRTARVGGRRAG